MPVRLDPSFVALNPVEPDMPDVIRVTCRLICFRDPDDFWTNIQRRHPRAAWRYVWRIVTRIP